MQKDGNRNGAMPSVPMNGDGSSTLRRQLGVVRTQKGIEERSFDNNFHVIQSRAAWWGVAWHVHRLIRHNKNDSGKIHDGL